MMFNVSLKDPGVFEKKVEKISRHYTSLLIIQTIRFPCFLKLIELGYLCDPMTDF